MNLAVEVSAPKGEFDGWKSSSITEATFKAINENIEQLKIDIVNAVLAGNIPMATAMAGQLVAYESVLGVEAKEVIAYDH